MISLVVALLSDIQPINLGGQKYVHRYSKGNLHEFTPTSQKDLKAWTDMITINDYESVKSGEDLARCANNVLTTYKDHGAKIINTSSVPRTSKKEAEHMIVALFPTGDFQEASFAKFMLLNGKAFSLVYSHRTYGKTAGKAMSEWLLSKGEATEKLVKAVSEIPKH